MKTLKLFAFALLLLNLIVNACLAQTASEPTRGQVKFFFPGAKLPADFRFSFPVQFEELTIMTRDSVPLSALLFKADSAAKGVILYLHGNTSGLDKWGQISKVYTSLHYDLMMLDYRGYGKSAGQIKNEAQLYGDVQSAYDVLKLRYSEAKIIVLGYSIGTGLAVYLAANNHPEKLILQAPYYSLPDAIHHLRPGYDTTRIAFHFNTWQFLKQTTAQVIIFHGDQDKMFYYGSSEKLKAFFKPGDELITLKGAGHGYMDQNAEYLENLKRVLK